MNINNNRKLSKEQINAINCEDKNILVSAGPGSGKTVVIINRVYNLIHTKKVSPKNIIVITFTKAAATNMRRRFLTIDQSGISPFFGTFHGLCFKILKSYYGEANIIESFESYNVIKKFLSTYMEEISEDRVKEYENAIAVYKCKGKFIRSDFSNVDEEILMGCFNFYEAYKKEKGLWDFQDLQLLTRDLLKKNARLLETYRRQFLHILVDEFQDTDDVQVEILVLLKGENNIFVVGDEDQCIYSFRGANPKYMVNFKDIFKGGRTLYLSTNYRSTSNIVNLSMKSIKNNEIRTEKNIIAFNKDKGIIKFEGTQNENSQGSCIADNILKLKQTANLDFNNFAVLYRTNLESRSIIDSFIKKKIPFTLLDKQYNFFTHFICQDILAYLKLSIYPMDMDSFIKIINKPYRYISKTTIEELKQSGGLNPILTRLKQVEKLPIFQMKAIDNLERDINSLNRMTLSTAVDFIISDLNYHDHLKEYAKKFSLSIDDLENVLTEFKESVKEFKTIKEFLIHVQEVDEETKKAQGRKDRGEGVVLSTIHGVKGMEFDTVFIINTVDGVIPYKDNDLEEERRLFYVGITRAINNLYFTAPSIIRGEKKNKSLFLKECHLEDEVLEAARLKVGGRVVHSFYGEGTIKEIKDNNISIQFNDLERKFDLMVVLANGLVEAL